MQGAGKTTLLKAILNKCKQSTAAFEDVVSEVDVQEGIAGGLCYCDSAGINMQVFSFSSLFSFCFFLQSGLYFMHLVIFKMLLLYIIHGRKSRIFFLSCFICLSYGSNLMSLLAFGI